MTLDISSILPAMTLEQKAGQVIFTGFEGTAFSASLREFLIGLQPGGLVIFGRNVADRAQLAGLIAAAQGCVCNAGLPALAICIDQEGGRVARLREEAGFTEFPSAMAVAATGDPANARLAARIMAAEMRSAGINMAFAPVLDVNNNPANPVIGTRSFGSDPAMVARLGAIWAETLQEQDVMAVGKHFPGHGDTTVDSHCGLPAVQHPKERLEAVELVPFRAAIAAGIGGIMSAHINFPAVDATPGLPATLSAATLGGLLRDELGFDGLILTDSLEMGALAAAGHPLPAAAVEALAAGADVLLFNSPAAVVCQAHQAVVDAVRGGALSESRLDDAVRRVLAAKARFGILDGVTAVVAEAKDPGEARRSARSIAVASITLLRDDAGLLPLRPRSPALVIEAAAGAFMGAPAATRATTPGGSGTGQGAGVPNLAAALGARGTWCPADPDEAEMQRIVAEAEAALRRRGADKGTPIIVATHEVASHPAQAALVQRLIRAGFRVIVVAAGAPYDLLAFPEVRTYLAVYGWCPPSIAALAQVLRGDARPVGHLPVDLPGLYPLGAGMGDFGRPDASGNLGTSGLTEARNPASAAIDTVSTPEMVRLMSDEDARVAAAVAAEAPAIAAAIDAVAARLAGGGRLIYAGAGTSGRLGVLDASECHPTFGTPPGQVVGLIAGGKRALTDPVEAAEDDPAAGARDLAALHVSARDAVVGIAASGRTPYVLGVLEAARRRDALTVGITCNHPSPMAALAAISIAPRVGPEIIAGSTRLKAGTAQKMVLNMLSTGVMIRLGKTFGNLMVDMQASNSKLRVRALRIVVEACELPEDEAAALLERCGGEVKTAVICGLGGLEPEEGRRRLAAAGGVIRRALAGSSPTGD